MDCVNQSSCQEILPRQHKNFFQFFMDITTAMAQSATLFSQKSNCGLNSLNQRLGHTQKDHWPWGIHQKSGWTFCPSGHVKQRWDNRKTPLFAWIPCGLPVRFRSSRDAIGSHQSVNNAHQTSTPRYIFVGINRSIADQDSNKAPTVLTSLLRYVMSMMIRCYLRHDLSPCDQKRITPIHL